MTADEFAGGDCWKASGNVAGYNVDHLRCEDGASPSSCFYTDAAIAGARTGWPRPPRTDVRSRIQRGL